MIGNITEKEWGARFQLQTIRQAQAAMSEKAALAELVKMTEKITRTHHDAMKHSARTGRTEYTREADCVVICNDTEMERQKIMCDFLHRYQWQLDEARVQHKPVSDLQKLLDECFTTMEQSLTKKIEAMFTAYTSHAQSRPNTLSGHGSMQDTSMLGSDDEECDFDSSSNWDVCYDTPADEAFDSSSHWDDGYDTSADEGFDNGDPGELHYTAVFYYCY